SFVYHNGELLHEEGREEKKTSYHLGAGIDAFRRGQELYYYQQDEQLSTTLVTDVRGGIQNSYLYDAFGVETGINEQYPNRIRYTGQQYDELTEQYYLRARHYNPVLGRFMQEDVYQGDGLNLYAYCGNNPVVHYDPSGYADIFLPNGSRTNWGTEHGRNNPPHNNSIEVELDWASSMGATDIAKNGWQRDASGNFVTYTDPVTNRQRRIQPDASYTIDGVRYNTNYVSDNSTLSGLERELTAYQHMVEADPDAVNTLVVNYDDPLKPKTDDTVNEISDEIKEETCK
ncbi:MAG: RHS repeat-associated core domain-containing protein, partial [Acetatifactor sp.]